MDKPAPAKSANDKDWLSWFNRRSIRRENPYARHPPEHRAGNSQLISAEKLPRSVREKLHVGVN